MTPRILIIEDDRFYRATIDVMLSASEFLVRSTPDGQRGIAIAREFEADLVIVDWMLQSESNGAEIATCLKEFPVPPKVILMTGYIDLPMRIPMAGRIFDAILNKPFHKSELMETIQSVLNRDGVIPDSAPTLSEEEA